jgi:predicted enzyme related to lactoylglutathione lyase
MPVFESYPQGTPCFVDLVTPGLAAAQEFYGSLFGWSYGERRESESASYAVATLDGHVVAGLDGDMPSLAGHPAFWRVYLAVDDVDAVTGRVSDLGGLVESGPTVHGDREHTSAIKDPTGVRVNLWQARSHPGTELANEVGTPVWNELVTPDLSRATSFYADLLGVSWSDAETPGGPYRLLQVGGRSVGAAVPLPEGPQPPHWNVYFSVEDTDAALAGAVDLGGKALGPARDVAGAGRIGMVRDPQGGTFAVLQNPPAADGGGPS